MFIFSLSNASVSFSNKNILKNINWQVKPGEHWAVLGGNGAGKSTLLRLIAGTIWPSDKNTENAGAIWPSDKSNENAGTIWPKEASENQAHTSLSNPSPLPPQPPIIWNLKGQKETSPIAATACISLISPELQNWYAINATSYTGEEIIISGLRKTPLLYSEPEADELQSVASVAQNFNLTHLLGKTAASMSQGQLRSILLARTLVSKPSMAILDEAFDGLDEASRKSMGLILESMAKKGTTILASEHRMDDMPTFLTHCLYLENGEAVSSGPIKNAELISTQFQNNEAVYTSSLPSFTNSNVNGTNKGENASANDDTNVFELKNINVFIERHHILHNINWQTKKGEHWAVRGDNGSGKTTLLRYLQGELPHALGGEFFFEGEGEPLNFQTLRTKMGIISDRLQASIDPQAKVEDIIISGFYASIDLYEEPDKATCERCEAIMNSLNLIFLKGRLAKTLSYGQLRKTLLARAIFNNIKVLLLDEPCSGLDAASRNDFLVALKNLASKGTIQIIFISHHPADFSEIATHELYLKDGKVIHSGSR